MTTARRSNLASGMFLVNEVLLAHSHSHSSVYCLWLLSYSSTGLSGCNTQCDERVTSQIHVSAPYGKSLPVPNSGSS